jgi:MoaA/NifB/PqqE/SkfB family radical SAM enzyme
MKRTKKNSISKMLPKSRQNHRIKDVGDFPEVILIDTVNYCNLRCSMCGRRKMTRKGGTMDIKLYKKIIDEITVTNKNTPIWPVFFGDPFMLGSKLKSYLTYPKEKGLEVKLNTNGNLMGEKQALTIIESGIDSIYIGIDATTAEVYEQLRVGGNFKKVVKNVEYLLKLKKELNAKKPKVICQFVVMEKNKHQVDDYIEYWTSRGVTVKVRPKVSWAGTVESEDVDNRKRHPCYWGIQSFNILYDGRVALCAVDYDGKIIGGDVSKESLKSVWNGKLKEIRELMLQDKWDKLPPFCRDCTDWQKAVNVTFEPKKNNGDSNVER